jgi:hypothetical protein
VNGHAELLNSLIAAHFHKLRTIEWLSPLASDDFAESRDRGFLQRIGHPELAPKLGDFWPARGPQWDALARSDGGDIILVEAKAHIDELCSPPTQASEASRAKIEAALSFAAVACGAVPRAAWSGLFYQLANRLAHLHLLRSEGISAYLVLVNFIRDTDMAGPTSEAEWKAAYRVAYHVMGLSAGSGLLRYVLHIYPDTSLLV